MSDPPSPHGSIWIRTLGGLLFALAIPAVLICFPAVNPCGPQSPRLGAKSDTSALIAAVKAYNIEYGKYPGLDRQSSFTDEESNAFLLRVLSAVDVARNPRRIVFLEVRERRSDSDSGRNPESGAFLDPWGRPYCIAIDADYDNVIVSPYSNDPPIETGVIVWSLGKDGQLGSPGNPHSFKNSDDVTSWP